MAETLPPVVTVFEADVSRFEEGCRKMGTSMRETSTSVEENAKRAAAGIAHAEEKTKSAAGAASGGIPSWLSLAGGMAAAMGAANLLESGFNALKSVTTDTSKEFVDYSMSVARLQRATGESAEEASKFGFAARMSGIDTNQLSTALKFLSKDMAEHPEKLAAIGVATRDASGQMRDMSDVMLDVADKFEAMDDGAAKNDLAMKLFGRSGMDMVKMLDQGKEGLQTSMEAAKKYGLVLGDDQVKAAKDNVRAHREMDAAWQGLQITIGQYVTPYLTILWRWLADKIPTAIEYAKFAIFMLQGALQLFVQGWTGTGTSDSPLQRSIQDFGRNARKVFDWLLENVPKIVAWLMENLPKAIQWATDRWHEFQAGIGEVQRYWAMFQAGLDTIRDSAVFKWLVDTITGVKQTIADLVGFVQDVINGDWSGAWNKAKDIVFDIFDNIKNGIFGFGAAIGDALKGPINSLIDSWNGLIDNIVSNPIGDLIAKVAPVGAMKIPHLAAGGIVPATPGGRMIVAGEGGRDEVVAPIDRLGDMIAKAVAQAGGQRTQAPTTVNLVVDGRTLAAVVVPHIRNREMERI